MEVTDLEWASVRHTLEEQLALCSDYRECGLWYVQSSLVEMDKT